MLQDLIIRALWDQTGLLSTLPCQDKAVIVARIRAGKQHTGIFIQLQRQYGIVILHDRDRIGRDQTLSFPVFDRTDRRGGRRLLFFQGAIVFAQIHDAAVKLHLQDPGHRLIQLIL